MASDVQRRLVKFSVVLLLVATAACGGGQPAASTPVGASPVAAAAPKALGSVVVCSGADGGFSTVIVPVLEGSFQKQGVEASLRLFPSTAEIVPAMFSGDCDITLASEATLMLAKSKGAVHVVDAAMTSSQNVALVTNKDIQSRADLIGKKIGYVEGTASELYMTLYFEKHKLDLTKVTKVKTTVPNMVPVFQRGEIDAFFLWRPNPDLALKAVPSARILAWNADDGVYVQTNYHLFSDRLAGNAQLAQASMRALLDGEDLINKEPGRVAPGVATKIQQTPEQVQASLSVLKHHIELTPENLAGLQGVAKWLVGAGRLPSTPDWQTFFKPDFLRAVAASRVTLK